MQETTTNVLGFDEALNIGKEIIFFFQNEFSQETFWLQIASIAVAALLAFFISKSLGQKLETLMGQSEGDSIGAISARFILRLSRKLLFSAWAAFILFTEIALLKIGGVIAPSNSFALSHVANQVFFAWAMLVLVVELIDGLFLKKHMSARVKKMVYSIFWFFAILSIVGVLPLFIETMKAISIPIGSSDLSLWSVFIGLMTILFSVGVANWLSSMCDAAIRRASDIDANLKIVLSRLISIAFFAIAILVALASMGLNLTVLSVFGGAVGVGLGFGLQKIASNYISGFIILFDHSIKLGDLVETAGFSGQITQINTRYSVIRNFNGEEMIIPNENFVTGSFKNLSHTERSLVGSVQISIGYECDVDKAQAILVDIVKAQPRILPSPAPWAVVTDFGADGIDLKVSFWIRDPENGTSVLRSNIMKAALARFTEAGISIPYSIRDVRINGELRLKKDEDKTPPSN